jgi:hypothetical protein
VISSGGPSGPKWRRGRGPPLRGGQGAHRPGQPVRPPHPPPDRASGVAERAFWDVVPGVTRDDWATYSAVLDGRFFVAIEVTAGAVPGVDDVPQGRPYVYVWEPVEWDPP